MFDVFYIGKKPGLFAHELPVDTIEQAIASSRTRYCWVVNYLCNYQDWDWLWEPSPWESRQRHAWPSQWTKDSGTYLIPKNGFNETNYRSDKTIQRLASFDHWDSVDVAGFDYTWHPDPTDPPYIYQFGTQWQKTGGPRYVVPGANEIKYVEQIKINTKGVTNRVVLINHLDSNVEAVKQQLLRQFDEVTVVRYFDNYLDTLRRIAKNNSSETGYIWICSSVCDYSNFDFSWHPEQWQSTMLHVFASNEQKFGDTFFMHPSTFAYRSEQCQLLDWYDVNYVPRISVPRWNLPVVQHTYDTHVAAVKSIDWPGTLAVFVTGTNNAPETVPTVALWREKTKTVVPLNSGASAVVVPKAAVPYVKTQIYDYPYIDKKHSYLNNTTPLDIVFISNGEVNAEHNWNWLNRVVDQQQYLNRIVRSDGVNGRVAAYRAAAEASQTPWFFAVFAKLEVNPAFDWTWQPDRLQQPKHYIFHAYNPVTGLEYGHMAMIAYNKQLVLENTATGLDFTLDQEHEVVPIMSGIAYYYNSAWMCWRTAFRECIKLRYSLPDVENEYRLQAWLDNNLVGNDYGEWSRRGAADAVEYYDSVDGNFEELRRSYDWSWLASYAFMRHGLTPDQ